MVCLVFSWGVNYPYLSPGVRNCGDCGHFGLG